jgi:hypothetical protein
VNLTIGNVVIRSWDYMIRIRWSVLKFKIIYCFFVIWVDGMACNIRAFSQIITVYYGTDLNGYAVRKPNPYPQYSKNFTPS